MSNGGAKCVNCKNYDDMCDCHLNISINEESNKEKMKPKKKTKSKTTKKSCKDCTCETNIGTIEIIESPIEIKIEKHPNAKLPEYKTKGSSGMDVYAHTNLPIWVKPGEIRLIPTGLRIIIPLGYELQVRARSGLALNKGITLGNGVGTVDSDFRDEVGVIIYNHGAETFQINRGDRIAQLVCQKVETVVWNEISPTQFTEIVENEYNDRKGGFGSTGK